MSFLVVGVVFLLYLAGHTLLGVPARVVAGCIELEVESGVTVVIVVIVVIVGIVVIVPIVVLLCGW